MRSPRFQRTFDQRTFNCGVIKFITITAVSRQTSILTLSCKSGASRRCCRLDCEIPTEKTLILLTTKLLNLIYVTSKNFRQRFQERRFRSSAFFSPLFSAKTSEESLESDCAKSKCSPQKCYIRLPFYRRSIPHSLHSHSAVLSSKLKFIAAVRKNRS